MTRPGFVSLAALLAVGLLASTWLLLRGAIPGTVEVLACEEWLRRPREGTFRLRDCAVDTSTGYARVTSPSAALELTEGIDSPGVRARLDRIWMAESAAERARVAERYGDALVVVTTLEGRVTHAADTEYDPEYLLVPRRTSSFVRALGVVIALVCVPLLLLLVPAQRRWTARAEALRRSASGESKPVEF